MKYTRIKDRGILSARIFFDGDLVLRYCGDLVRSEKGCQIEAGLQKDRIDGSYLFFFEKVSKCCCLNDTRDNGSYGCLGNRSR